MQTTCDIPDLFTERFKYFRRLADVNCFTEALTISNHPSQFHRCQSSNECLSIEVNPSLGLQPISTWSLYACPFAQGLYFIPNPFTLDGQRLWINRSVNEYARQNRTSVGDNFNNEHLAKLRWVTLGYHYDWTNKIYRSDDFTRLPQELDQLLETLMKYFSSITGRT